MKALKEFQKRFLVNPQKLKSPIKTINIFQDRHTIYFVSVGLMKQKMKSKIENNYSKCLLDKVFVSIVPNRNFSENDEILLDTYVWVSSEPEHYIHYPSSPVLRAHKTNKRYD
ncbi:MAG: hypothetical protein A2057_05485 [Ignavibacteria bacterium GWA2_35_9]|nr:MAG: hypothetical protein A2057_05485 [Ignavibacteria bacterium GWA2_35_9]OGU43045.1 MAG: hypothetical protein A2000_03105 [Ignavibacteria bacterium GWB2_36_8]OGU52245.1 MAG: hypothetical protein A2080_08260 [Ignavibacteria bacterium GWC2_36_12]